MSFYNFTVQASKKSHGVPLQGQNQNKEYPEFEHMRQQVVKAYNCRGCQVQAFAATPFRIVENAGDVLSRSSYSCGGVSQTPQSRAGVFGIKGRFGSIQSQCDGSGIPPSSCNTAWVYDSQDYMRYLKKKNTFKNYYDSSNGGDDFHAGQSKWKAMRRY